MHKNMRRLLMILYLQESSIFTEYYSLAIRKYLGKLKFKDKIYLWNAREKLLKTYNKNWRRNGN